MTYTWIAQQDGVLPLWMCVPEETGEIVSSIRKNHPVGLVYQYGERYAARVFNVYASGRDKWLLGFNSVETAQRYVTDVAEMFRLNFLYTDSDPC